MAFRVIKAAVIAKWVYKLKVSFSNHEDQNANGNRSSFMPLTPELSSAREEQHLADYHHSFPWWSWWCCTAERAPDLVRKPS